jgi:hypothetical protein
MKKIVAIGVTDILIFSGCKKEEKYTDEDAILEIVKGSPLFNQSVPTGQDSAFISLQDTLSPLFWGREINNLPAPKVDIYITGDSAFVDYTGYDEGILHLWAWNYDSSKIKYYQKDFADISYIKGAFKRTGSPDDPRRGWELWSITGIHTLSRYNTTDFKIDSIKVKIGNNTVTVTDPLSFHKLSEIDTIQKYDTVGITVYVNQPVDYPYFHILGPDNKHYRLIMNEVFPGVYEKNIVDSSDVTGYHWAIVDILGDETLGTSEGVYKAELWFYLYYKK